MSEHQQKTLKVGDPVTLDGVVKAIYPLKHFDPNAWEGDHPVVGSYAEVEVHVVDNAYDERTNHKKLIYVNTVHLKAASEAPKSSDPRNDGLE